MQSGDIVRLESNATPDGTRQAIGIGVLVRKVGTVPNFWEAEVLEGSADHRLATRRGTKYKLFIFPDQVIQVRSNELTATEPPAFSLKVIQGGQRGQEKEQA